MSVPAELDSLLRTPRQYVEVSLDGDTLHVHARVMRVEEGDRFVVIDHRATLPNTLKSELDDALERIRELSVAMRKQSTESLARLRVVVTAERDGAERVSRDTLFEMPLRDFADAQSTVR